MKNKEFERECPKENKETTFKITSILEDKSGFMRCQSCGKIQVFGHINGVKNEA